MTARNCIVLHQKYTILSSCNSSSCVNFSSVGVCSSREKVEVSGRRDNSFPGCTQVWLVSYAVRLELKKTVNKPLI